MPDPPSDAEFADVVLRVECDCQARSSEIRLDPFRHMSRRGRSRRSEDDAEGSCKQSALHDLVLPPERGRGTKPAASIASFHEPK